MARGGVAISNMLLLRRGLGKRAGLSKLLECDAEIAKGKGKGKGKSMDSCWSCSWVPHPRTGIYFPVGHEWVMEDVPHGAATFPHTCCFRNVDGVHDHCSSDVVQN